MSVWDSKADADSLGLAVFVAVDAYLAHASTVFKNPDRAVCLAALAVPVCSARAVSSKASKSGYWEVVTAERVGPNAVLKELDRRYRSAVVLAVHYLDAAGRGETVPDEVRGAASLAMLSGLELS